MPDPVIEGVLLDKGGMVYNVRHSTFAAQGDGVADDRAALAAADAAAAAAGGGTVAIPRGVYRIGSNLTLSSALAFDRGAILKPDLGVTVTLNGAVVAGHWQIFDLRDDNGTTLRKLTSWVSGFGENEALFPEWFGAKGNYHYTTGVGVSASRAWQHCVETAERTFASSIRYAGRHYFTEPVVVLRGGFTVHGPSGAVHAGTGVGPGPAGLYGALNLRCIFDWGGSQTSDFPTQLAFQNVCAIGGPATYIGNAQRFLEVSEMQSYPLSHLTFRDCHFRWFQYAVCEVTGAGEPTVAHVLFDACEIKYCEHALLITSSKGTAPSNGTVANLRFVGCYSSQGGRITCAQNGAITGSVVIEENILEGQSNPVDLRLGYGCVRIGPNYFEGNEGTLVRVSASNPYSTVEFSDQRVAGSNPQPSAWLDASGLRVIAPTAPPGLVLSSIASRRSILRGGVVVPNTGSAALSLDPVCVPGTSPAPGGVRSTGVYEWGGNPRLTPWGVRNTQVLTGFDTTRSIAGLNYQVGDWLTVCVALRYTDSVASTTDLNPLIVLYSTGAQSFAASKQGSLVADHGDGWLLMMFCARAEVQSANLAFRFNPYDGLNGTGPGCIVGPLWMYSIAPDPAGATFLPPYVP